ncbi:transglutaminase domain-containing protein [Siminovitchia sediminis]|uniref:Transglutaminase domain-containing protein n=1 Tax=Siminovitchia sediminis TaxID=1274353 RepID=A0ABW4KGX1_9BACI
MKQSQLLSFLLYVLGFMLILEWLLPLEQITQTSEIHYFVVFVLLSLLLNFLQAPWFISWPLKAAFIFCALFAIFSGEMGLGAWTSQLVDEIRINTVMVFKSVWLDLSPLYRSFLFFLLLWQITYLLRYWLTIKRKVFVFYVMTILYVTLLDTFTEYSGRHAIVRIVIIGFTLLGVLFFKRLYEKEQMEDQFSLLGRWIIPLFLVVCTGVGIGYLSPKAAPIWPDPVPFLESKAESIRNGGVSKIGYGMDDTQLGGPFIHDDRVVFIARTPTSQYWKIETKDVYTGKGWVASSQASAPIADIQYGEVRRLDTVSSSNNPIQEATLDFEISYPHIVRPYGFLSVEKQTEGNGFVRYDSRLDKLHTFTEQHHEERLKSYTITYREAVFSKKALRQTQNLPGGADYTDFQEQYTQLPETLPRRVHTLAEKLTAEHDNWYDKARAIEAYFQTGEFSYDQTNVAVPANDEDYVDQFLFDTQRGYCDNFSTSMVVMLRTLDIPARWVKGYAPGNYKGMSDADNRLYEITNNEAHSWVEVFFPEQGWVPFEPTKGFNNPIEVVNDEHSNSTSSSSSDESVPESEETEQEEQAAEIDENSSSGNEFTLRESGFAEFFMKYWRTIALVLFSIIAGASGLFISRNRWIPRLLIWKYKINKNDTTFAEAYETLLKRLDSFGLKKGPGQTLRNYASVVDDHFGTTDMSQLTERYEKLIYGGEETHTNWEYSKELWENLIKKTIN